MKSFFFFFLRVFSLRVFLIELGLLVVVLGWCGVCSAFLLIKVRRFEGSLFTITITITCTLSIIANGTRPPLANQDAVG